VGLTYILFRRYPAFAGCCREQRRKFCAY